MMMFLPRWLERGDKVRLKKDHHWGTVTWINGPHEAFTVNFGLGSVDYSCNASHIQEYLKPGSIKGWDKL